MASLSLLFPFADIATATDATYRSTISFSIFFYSIFFFPNRYVNYLAENYLILFFCGQCCGLTPALFCASASFLSVFGDVCVIGSKRTAGSGTPSPLVCPPPYPSSASPHYISPRISPRKHTRTHTQQDPGNVSIFILFPFLFYFWLIFLLFPSPHSVCGWGSSIWPVVEEKNFGFAFFGH